MAAALADQVTRLDRSGGVTVAFLASGGQTRVRLSAKAATREQALALIEPEERAARDALGSAVYGVDDDTLEGVVAGLLRARGETVAVAESLTGGLLGASLTDAPGASDVFRGGVVAYATEAKEQVLGVPGAVLSESGAVSGSAAAAMARRARELFGSTYGLAVTGVAGPAEQEGQPAGTVHVAVAGPDGDLVRSLRLPGDRGMVRRFTVVAVLNLLRLQLLGASS